MIFVDNLRKYRRQSYCHMVSDASFRELHEFAQRAGIARHWFHRDHYDLRAAERTRAVELGAQEENPRIVVKALERLLSNEAFRMNAKPVYYAIVETPCFPRRFKIKPVGNWVQNNSWTEYFSTIDEAEAEIKKRHALRRTW